MSYINKSALKEFILQKIRKIRPYWKCNRVSGSVASLYNHRLEVIILNHEKIEKNDSQREANLIVKSKVKRRMLEVHNKNHPWFKTVSVSDAALDFVELELEKIIIHSIETHPCGLGSTFKP